MKVPPKRKGNSVIIVPGVAVSPLNESPSEKEGKYALEKTANEELDKALNESPSEKEGKCKNPGSNPRTLDPQ